MSAQVLLNLLNKLGKRDKMRGLPSILLLFHNEFNKFNNTGAGLLDSFYPMTLKTTFNSYFFCMKKLRLCHIYAMLLRTSLHSVTKICKSPVVYRF